jgi:hypothetical protein
MSMSQEEIEALMSGAGEITADAGEELQEEVSIEDLDPALSPPDEMTLETDEIALDEPIESELSELNNEEESLEDNLDNLDDILAGIDGIVDDVPEDKPEDPIESTSQETDAAIESLIDQNQYPMPAKDENKVVSQLNQVADDSEEKASQIFDVLSFILDENSEIQNYNKNMGEFVENQLKLLESLAVKFPNISVFKDNLEKAKEIAASSSQLDDKINGENNKIFEAMELMQYHDINRQKIERVMSVIKKLNSYLNGIFEDDSEKPEVQIAKHISGDSNDIVDANDIESLISEFSGQEG